MVIGAAILVNLLILFSMILYHMFSNKENVWQNDYFFRDCFGLVYMFTLMGVMMVFRPMEGAEMLVEVNEFLDETLTEVGPPQGEMTQRLDSEEYGTTLERRMKERQ
jgi:hypothetical protein